MPNTIVPAIQQRLRANAESICFKCFYRKVCRAIDNQPCIECNQFTDAHGVTVQEWISVKDRLPEENERVLACYINPLRKDRPPRMMVGEGTSTQIVKGKVYLWCGGWRSITHWMPLPQPPKGE